jgi:hypothetical protein
MIVNPENTIPVQAASTRAPSMSLPVGYRNRERLRYVA